MPGAWEQRYSVLVAILHTDVTTIAWSFGLRNLIVPGQITALTGMPFDHARNTACQQAMDGGFTHVFFLDSDVVPPASTILRLLAHNKPFISGIYCRRSPPVSVPVMIKNGQWVTQYPANSLIEVDFVGAGCLLISRDCLERCPPQRPGHRWFDWKVNYRGLLPEGECLSEDFTLCRWLKLKLGIPTIVDTSIQCKHIGYAESTYGRLAPLETSPIT